MFTSFLNLKEDIGSDRPVDEDDTLKAKHAFKSIGYYDEPSYGMTPYPDQPLFDGIKKFQKDKDLYQDALMEPGGETVTALNKELGKFNSAQKNEKNSNAAEIKELTDRLKAIDARIRELIDMQYKTTDPETLRKIRNELTELGKKRGDIQRTLRLLRGKPVII